MGKIETFLIDSQPEECFYTKGSYKKQVYTVTEICKK